MQCLWQRDLTPCRQAQGRCPLPLRQDAGLGPFMIEPSDWKKRVKARAGLPGANHTELSRQAEVGLWALCRGAGPWGRDQGLTWGSASSGGPGWPGMLQVRAIPVGWGEGKDNVDSAFPGKSRLCHPHCASTNPPQLQVWVSLPRSHSLCQLRQRKGKRSRLVPTQADLYLGSKTRLPDVQSVICFISYECVSGLGKEAG